MEEEIDLREIFEIFWNKRIWIILAAIVGIFLGGVYTNFIVVPEYSSSATLVLTKSTENTPLTGSGITQTDINLNQKLISAYREIIKSKAVVNMVIDDLKLDMDYEELNNKITVEAVSNTDFLMNVTVTTTDPELSAKIVNTLIEEFVKKSFEIFGIENTYDLDMGEVELEPINVNLAKSIVIFTMVAVILVMMIIFMIYFFDTSFKNKIEAERFLNIPVLAVIPLTEDEGAQEDEKKRK